MDVKAYIEAHPYIVGSIILGGIVVFFVVRSGSSSSSSSSTTGVACADGTVDTTGNNCANNGGLASAAATYAGNSIASYSGIQPIQTDQSNYPLQSAYLDGLLTGLLGNGSNPTNPAGTTTNTTGVSTTTPTPIANASTQYTSGLTCQNGTCFGTEANVQAVYNNTVYPGTGLQPNGTYIQQPNNPSNYSPLTPAQLIAAGLTS